MSPYGLGNTSSHVAEQSNATRGSVHLGKNDPIPQGIERNLLEINELILEVRDELYVIGCVAMRLALPVLSMDMF
jgi:hypothetical protein